MLRTAIHCERWIPLTIWQRRPGVQILLSETDCRSVQCWDWGVFVCSCPQFIRKHSLAQTLIVFNKNLMIWFEIHYLLTISCGTNCQTTQPGPAKTSYPLSLKLSEANYQLQPAPDIGPDHFSTTPIVIYFTFYILHLPLTYCWLHNVQSLVEMIRSGVKSLKYSDLLTVTD